MNEKDFITLLQLQQIIKNGVEESVPKTVWVRGEIVEIKENYSGHCYIELADYDSKAQLVAKARAVIWASNYQKIKPYFFSVTGSDLSAGMHVLFRVQVQYSVVYGLNLVVVDIDPQFSIGELELKRQQTIKRLEDEGLMDMNSNLELPVILRKFAIVSAASAAGYRDFVRHLHQNDYGFKFSTYLFPSPMQGREAQQGVVEALDKIFEYNEMLKSNNDSGFDAVIIIRGGGSIIDLSVFDDYEIASHIAQFPIPVITGIGHDHDFHIADMVANVNLKTPTAVADFIIDNLAEEHALIESLSSRLKLAAVNKLNDAQAKLMLCRGRFREALFRRIDREEYRLNLIEQRLRSSDVLSKLRDGEVIVKVNGKGLSGGADFKEGATVALYMKREVVKFNIVNVEISEYNAEDSEDSEDSENAK